MERIKIRCFMKPQLLKDGIVGTKDYLLSNRMEFYTNSWNYAEAEQLRQYFLLNDQPVGHMHTTEEILIDLVTDGIVIHHLSGTDEQVPIIETYDMDGINIDIHARDKRRAMIKEFSRKPGKQKSRRASFNGTKGRRITPRRQRRQSVARLNARKNKKRKKAVNSNNSYFLRNSELDIGQNNVFKSNSWVEVDEMGGMENNNTEELQEGLETGASAYINKPKPNNENPFTR